MHWLFMGLAALSFFVAFRTTSVAVLTLCLLGALGFLVLWLIGAYSARMGERQRSGDHLLSPEELRRLREQAEARRAQSGDNGDA
jgi:hypothetical protein